MCASRTFTKHRYSLRCAVRTLHCLAIKNLISQKDVGQKRTWNFIDHNGVSMNTRWLQLFLAASLAMLAHPAFAAQTLRLVSTGGQVNTVTTASLTIENASSASGFNAEIVLVPKLLLGNPSWQAPACRGVGSWSFHDRVPNLEIGNERKKLSVCWFPSSCSHRYTQVVEARHSGMDRRNPSWQTLACK